MSAPDGGECVRVVVRVRPLSAGERAAGHAEAVSVVSARREVTLASTGDGNGAGAVPDPSRTFTFDAAYGPEASQEEVFVSAAAPIVDSVLAGFNGTIFAYGQTGSGKSHTMDGAPGQPGVIPRAFAHIFGAIAGAGGDDRQFLVRASYLEIYQEEVRDLLATSDSASASGGLELKEHPETGVYVRDLTTCVVRSVAETEAVLTAGKRRRVTGRTAMNERSSRSHALFCVTVEASELGADGVVHIRVGKLNMVDLAGSERQSKTGAEGVRLKEAAKINLSLSALGNVISALVDGKSTHTPYRDSKLTRLLQDSLGGNTKTVMIANCGPASYNLDETLSTLRYAARTKQIKNKPRVNEDPKDTMLREFQEEIARLRAKLREEEDRLHGGGGGGSSGAATGEGDDARALRLPEDERRRLEGEVASRAEAAARARAEAATLAAQLATMQEQLLVGGRAHEDQALRAEAQLRNAQVELGARRRQEEVLARELEEANIMIEEQYASMADEVAAKTRKLRRVWAKLQSVTTDARDRAAESSRERDELLCAVRDLEQALKLKQLIIDGFIPPAEVERIESRAVWDGDAAEWRLRGGELAGNAARLPLRRPPASTSSALATLLLAAPSLTDLRPRSGAAARAAADSEAVAGAAALALDVPPRATADFVGAEQLPKSRLSAHVRAAMRASSMLPERWP